MTLEQARQRVEQLMLAGAKHADYDRTVAHAELCRAFATGQTDHLLQQFSRETIEEFRVRKQVSVSMSAAIWEELRKPYYQVSRLKGSQVTRTIDYPAQLSDAERLRRTNQLVTALDTCYNNAPLEDYLSERIARTVALTDPNAWLGWDFAPFDYRVELPKPYPVLYACESVVDFTRQAGTITSFTVIISEKRLGASGTRYVCHLDNDSIEYWPVLIVNGQRVPTIPEGVEPQWVVRDDTGAVKWEARVLNHRAGRVPALPIGYVPDEETDGRTFVSPLNPALAFLQAELKTGSELQIVMAQVAHPHKAQFVNRCEGKPNQNDGRPWGCTNGINSLMQTCEVCGGTTKAPIAHSALDTLTVPLPKDITDLKVKLNEMVAFTAPPVEVPKVQMEYQDRLVNRAKQVLFGTDVLSKTNVAQTATERMAQLAQLNSALMPFAELLSALYVHGGKTCAGYLDVSEGLALSYDFPPDLQPPSVEDLEAAYAAALKGGLDAAYLEMRYKALVRRKLADYPDELRKMEVKWRFLPFVGASDAYVLQMAALGYITVEKRTLRIEQDSIFYELQRDNPGFWEMPERAQQKLVDDKVKALVAQLPAGASGGTTFRQLSFNQPAGSAFQQGVGSFSVGESVMVKPGMEHMPAHKGLTMTVAEVQGNTYALKLPDGAIHKWYTADELMGMSPADKSTKMPAMVM